MPTSKENPKSKPVVDTLQTYKLKEYQFLGFTEYQARRLTDVRGLNVGTVRTVIQKGCKVKTAYRIFRP